MTGLSRKVPPGPTEEYDPSQDLLSWMAARSREYGDIFSASIYGSNAYVVSSPNYARHVLRKNWRNYPKGMAIKRIRLLLGNGLMVSEGAFWKSQRRMIQPAFHRAAVEALTDVIANANDALLSKWKRAACSHEPVNVTKDISSMVLDVVLKSLFSEDSCHVAEPFKVLSEESTRDLKFAEEFRPLRNVVSQIAAERRQKGRSGTDIMGVLLCARDADTGRAMPEHQLITEIMTLIVAGHETTPSTLAFMRHLLPHNPEVRGRLAQELDAARDLNSLNPRDLTRFPYARQVIDETMRLFPPGWLMTRKAIKDDQLGQYFVPARTEIYISPYLIQRNPNLWRNPESFDPGRFDPGQSSDRTDLAALPFSAGPRNCIGEAFARLEMQLHLITIAKDLQLQYRVHRPLELEAGINLRAKHDFIMFPQTSAEQKAG